MGKRGPKPKGSRQPSPLGGALEPPADLAGEALDEWYRVIGILQDLRVLSRSDAGAIADLCRMHAYSLAIDARIQAEGLTIEVAGRPKEHPLLRVRKQYADTVARLRREFGLTPSARTVVQADPAASAAEDELESFVKRRRASL